MQDFTRRGESGNSSGQSCAGYEMSAASGVDLRGLQALGIRLPASTVPLGKNRWRPVIVPL